MADSLPTPYKGRYTLSEFWPELTQGTLWKAYKKANPGEAAALEKNVAHKIAQEPHTTPHGLTHTHTGNALLMAILSMAHN